MVHPWENWCYILARTSKCGAFILRCFGISRKVNEREDVSVTNEHARRGTRQTNSERKGRLTVLGMWQAAGTAQWPRPTCYLAGSRCLSLLHCSHTDVKAPWRKPGRFCWGSHIIEEGGWGGICTLVLIWGQLHKTGARRGPHGYKPWGLNLNITSIKTWPKYYVCETEFSTRPQTWIDTWTFYTCYDRFLALFNDYYFPVSDSLTRSTASTATSHN